MPPQEGLCFMAGPGLEPRSSDSQARLFPLQSTILKAKNHFFSCGERKITSDSGSLFSRRGLALPAAAHSRCGGASRADGLPATTHGDTVVHSL